MEQYSNGLWCIRILEVQLGDNKKVIYVKITGIVLVVFKGCKWTERFIRTRIIYNSTGSPCISPVPHLVQTGSSIICSGKVSNPFYQGPKHRFGFLHLLILQQRYYRYSLSVSEAILYDSFSLMGYQRVKKTILTLIRIYSVSTVLQFFSAYVVRSKSKILSPFIFIGS
jgi:hypothetical protein